MRMPWNKPKSTQLELLDAETIDPSRAGPYTETVSSKAPTRSTRPNHGSHAQHPKSAADCDTGKPLLVALDRLIEDPNNPRTEFPDAEIGELSDDICQHGILQPLFAHPADTDGRYRLHFGALRLRAAALAGLRAVPVVVRDGQADPYAQVAENQKRHGLTPLDSARIIRGRVAAVDSNVTVAKRLGMNLTTVAHHLALLDLPPELGAALKSGRVTSPRTLDELSKLHAENPEQVQSLLDSGAEITRTVVSAARAETDVSGASEEASSPANKLIAQANAACDRLERMLSRIEPTNSNKVAMPELIALRIRVEDIANRWSQGSDRQTLLRRLTADSKEVEVERASKSRWQDWRAAGEWTPDRLASRTSCHGGLRT